MKNIIIGTAGHVDHGKTALIKALTGTDTDRLKEEKKRGITIELGFAHLDLGGGVSAGIVDVPGHERFIKNMLAGAGGVDLALLIVAADDGVMPQTREHLDILRLLDVREGIVALTKCDLADEDLRELVADDIRDCVKGTFLQGAPIVHVSSHTGEGIEDLKAQIALAAARAGEKNLALPFRLPIDRVFTMEGFGTVVTGTLTEGELREGGEAQIYPGEAVARVRSVQVHSKQVPRAYAGQRVAVNLSGVKKEELERGDTLAYPRSMERSYMLDVRLDILPGSAREIANGSRLHFYHGSRESLCKLAILDCDRLAPGQSGYAQLRFDEPVSAKKGDRFIVRFYSPVETVGGGIILDAAPQKHRRKAKAVLEALAVRESGGERENVLQTITDLSPVFAPLSDVRARCGMTEQLFDEVLNELCGAGSAFMLGKKCAVSLAFVMRLSAQARAALEEYHAANPLQAGMRRDALRQKLLPGRDGDLADKALGICAERGEIKLDGALAMLPDFKITYSEKDKKLSDAVEKMYLDGGFSPPDSDAVYAQFAREKAALKLVLDAMLSSGRLVLASPQICFHQSVVERATDILAQISAKDGGVTLADFRDAAQTSRKYALALLEYFDRKGVTQKTGDVRKLK